MPANNTNTRMIQYSGDDPELRKFIHKWDSVNFEYNEDDTDKILKPRCGYGYCIYRNVKDVIIKMPPTPYDGDMFAIMDVTHINEDHVNTEYRDKRLLPKESVTVTDLTLTTAGIYVDNSYDFVCRTKVIYNDLTYEAGDMFRLEDTCCYLYIFCYSRDINAWVIKWVEKECNTNIVDCGCAQPKVKVIIRFHSDGHNPNWLAHEDIFYVDKGKHFRKTYKNYEIYNFYSVDEAQSYGGIWSGVDVRDYISDMDIFCQYVKNKHNQDEKFELNDLFQHKRKAGGGGDGYYEMRNKRLVCTRNTIDGKDVYNFPFETGLNGVFYDLTLSAHYFHSKIYEQHLSFDNIIVNTVEGVISSVDIKYRNVLNQTNSMTDVASTTGLQSYTLQTYNYIRSLYEYYNNFNIKSTDVIIDSLYDPYKDGKVKSLVDYRYFYMVYKSTAWREVKDYDIVFNKIKTHMENRFSFLSVKENKDYFSLCQLHHNPKILYLNKTDIVYNFFDMIKSVISLSNQDGSKSEDGEVIYGCGWTRSEIKNTKLYDHGAMMYHYRLMSGTVMEYEHFYNNVNIKSDKIEFRINSVAENNGFINPLFQDNILYLSKEYKSCNDDIVYYKFSEEKFIEYQNYYDNYIQRLKNYIESARIEDFIQVSMENFYYNSNINATWYNNHFNTINDNNRPLIQVSETITGYPVIVEKSDKFPDIIYDEYQKIEHTLSADGPSGLVPQPCEEKTYPVLAFTGIRTSNPGVFYEDRSDSFYFAGYFSILESTKRKTYSTTTNDKSIMDNHVTSKYFDYRWADIPKWGFLSILGDRTFPGAGYTALVSKVYGTTVFTTYGIVINKLLSGYKITSPPYFNAFPQFATNNFNNYRDWKDYDNNKLGYYCLSSHLSNFIVDNYYEVGGYLDFDNDKITVGTKIMNAREYDAYKWIWCSESFMYKIFPDETQINYDIDCYITGDMTYRNYNWQDRRFIEDYYFTWSSPTNRKQEA